MVSHDQMVHLKIKEQIHPAYLSGKGHPANPLNRILRIDFTGTIAKDPTRLR